MPTKNSVTAPLSLRLKLLSVLAGLAVLCGLVFYAAAQLPSLQTEVSGSELSDEQKTYLQTRLSAELQGNFITLDLDEAQELIEQEQWISHALIEKSWPDRLKVRVVPKIAVAKFGSNRFVDSQGKVYRQASYFDPGSDLVNFYGPSNQTAEMMGRYEIVNRWFMDLGYQLNDVQFSSGGLWLFQFKPALTVIIAQNQSPARLYEISQLMRGDLAGVSDQIRVIDLRYVSAFSIGWKDRASDPQSKLESALLNQKQPQLIVGAL